jgi:hypothetical protein
LSLIKNESGDHANSF